MGAVSLVLLIASTNVVNLLSSERSRGGARSRCGWRSAPVAPPGSSAPHRVDADRSREDWPGWRSRRSPRRPWRCAIRQHAPIVLAVAPDARILAFTFALAVASAPLAGALPAVRTRAATSRRRSRRHARPFDDAIVHAMGPTLIADR
jgi:hypothetical protein